MTTISSFLCADDIVSPTFGCEHRFHHGEGGTLITHLRHVDLAVPDFDAQHAFYTGPWGLTEVAGDGDLSFLAAEGSTEPYVVRVRRSNDKRVDLLAFGAVDGASVDDLAARLGGGGVKLISEPGALDTPGGGYGFRFFDGDGRTLEVSCDVEERVAREIEPLESIPVNLSHVVLNSPNPEETVAWYLRHLSLVVSDQLTSAHLGDLMWFLRCDRFHHRMAVVRAPHASLHHVSFAMRGIEENLFGTGRVLRAGFERIWGPGKHLAGQNMFNYFLDPNGNTMEYTTEVEEIDEATWEPHVYDLGEPQVADQWGTANSMGPDVAMKSVNDPDRGLFVAPPV
jgi:catechol 2,3-dioxygenase-like lactoylglutathione lyase family enzyme